MTLEQFWTKQHQTMPKGKIKLRQPTDNAATELAQHDSEHEEDGEEAELDPGLVKVLDLMTTKLMVAIDNKFDPLAKTVLSHTTELKRANDRLDEAEARMLQLETASEPQANQIVDLERKVESLLDQIDELQNRGRQKNVRIFNLPENMEGRNALDFFEHWLPDFLDNGCQGGPSQARTGSLLSNAQARA